MGVYFILVIILLLSNLLIDDIDFYGVATAVGVLLFTTISSVAAWRLPSLYPKLYENAYFKIPRVLLRAIIIISLIICVGFAALVLAELPSVGFLYFGWTALIIIYYYLRVRYIKSKDLNWDERVKAIPGFDEE